MGGKKIIFLFLLFLTLLFAESAFAALPQETPYLAVGSEFLYPGGYSATDEKMTYPKVNTLFDNTKIYLDNNNDGVWDYSFFGNSGQTITLDPLIEKPRPGAKIRADKPVTLYQQGWYVSTSNAFYDYIYSVPPIPSLRKEYVVVKNYCGSWTLLSDRNTTVTINDRGVISTLELVRGEPKGIDPAGPAVLTANSSFLVASPSSPGALLSYDFFAQYPTIALAIIEPSTRVRIDSNNDGFFDSDITYAPGLYYVTTIIGARIKSDKRIALFSEMSGGLASSLPIEALGSDYFSTGTYIVKLYSEFNGIAPYTRFSIYTQKSDIVNLTIDSNISSWIGQPSNGPFHTISTMPALVQLLAHDRNARRIHLHPYTTAYLAQYSERKYVAGNEENVFVIRIFNPFIAETLKDISLNVVLPAGFLQVAPPIIERKSLRNDYVFESTNAALDELPGGFEIKSAGNPILASLPPLSYLEIRYSLLTPQNLGRFEFPKATMTYAGTTWKN